MLDANGTTQFRHRESTIYGARRHQTLAGYWISAGRSAALAFLAAIAVAGCDLEWGGAELALIDPSPVIVVEPDSVEVEAAVDLPLPGGPFLYAVHSDGVGGAWTLPIAAITQTGLDSVSLPGSFDDTYRERLDARTLPAGKELMLMADGHRIGTMVLDGTRSTMHAACPSVGAGPVLLSPGDELPEWSFAVALPQDPDATETPAARNEVVLDNRMRTFGPILTENLFESAGENRAYLAQRVVLEPIPFPDGSPGMTGTYLVNDRVDGDGPTGRGASLFFIARYEPTRGYGAVWSEVRRYGGGANGREIFVYRGASSGPLGRIDFAERLGGQSPILVAGVESADEDRREINWVESELCPSTDILRSAAGVSALEGPQLPPDESDQPASEGS